MTSRGGAASPVHQCSTACHCSDLRKVANGFRQRVAEKFAHMQPERPRSNSLKGVPTAPNCPLKSIGVFGCHLSEKPLQNLAKASDFQAEYEGLIPFTRFNLWP